MSNYHRDEKGRFASPGTAGISAAIIAGDVAAYFDLKDQQKYGNHQSDRIQEYYEAEGIRPTPRTLAALARDFWVDTPQADQLKQSLESNDELQYQEISIVRNKRGQIVGIASLAIEDAVDEKHVRVFSLHSADLTLKRVGASLMKAAAQRAESLNREGSSSNLSAKLSVVGAVSTALPFYASQGGRVSHQSSTVFFDSDDIRALSLGKPNDRRSEKSWEKVD